MNDLGSVAAYLVGFGVGYDYLELWRIAPHLYML